MKRGYFWGAAAGILSAMCYGMNPMGAVPLGNEGLGIGTVLLYRFGFAALILAAFIFATGGRFRLSRREAAIMATLGLLFAVSSLTYYKSMRVMDSGIACTVLFAYPIMTALIMTLVCGAKLRLATVASLVLATAGIMAISLGGGEHRVSAFGIALGLFSGLSYAVYIAIVDRGNIQLPLATMTFWAIAFCFAGIAAWTLFADGPAAFRLPATLRQWSLALFLAIVPTLLSLVLLAVSSQRIGATPTAILGALEPITAVTAGVFVFGEAFTFRLAIGIVLILAGVITILRAKRT